MFCVSRIIMRQSCPMTITKRRRGHCRVLAPAFWLKSAQRYLRRPASKRFSHAAMTVGSVGLVANETPT